MMSCCVAARMLMTGAILSGGATVRSVATDDYHGRLDPIIAHDLDTLRVRPGRRSSEIGAPPNCIHNGCKVVKCCGLLGSATLPCHCQCVERV